MRRMFAIVSAMALMFILNARPAHADPIGPNCNTCQGGIYTLEYAADATPGWYDIFLTINTSSYNGGGVAINAVAVKPASQVGSGTTLLAAPGGTANWQVVDGGLNANGCSGSGSGFECGDYIASGPGVAIGGTLVWEFRLHPSTALLTDPFAASFKVQFVDPNSNKAGALVSENITLQPYQPPPSVPEPTSMLLLGTGLIGIGGVVRRHLGLSS